MRTIAALGLALGVACTEPTAPETIDPVPTTLTVSLARPSLNVGETTTATVTATDQNGAPVSTGPVTWSSTPQASVSSGGEITAVSSGQATITATASGIAGQAALTITALPATALAVSTPPSASAQNRNALATQPIIRLVNASGGNVSQSGVVVGATVSAGAILGIASATTDANGVATFSGLSLSGPAGPREVSFSANGLTPISANVQLIAGAPASIGVSAGNQQIAEAGSNVSVPPAVLVTDADANPVPNAPVSFDVTSGNGTVTGSAATTNVAGVATLGSWKLGSPGLNTLQARIVNGTIGVAFSATATQAPALATINVAISPSALQQGQTVQAVATGVDQYGSAISTGAVIWSSSAPTASVSSTGLVTAVSAGQAVISAVAGGKTGQALITVTALPVLTSLSASVSPGSIHVGETAQATATGVDQFGAPFNVGNVAWSASSSVVSIASNGVITAHSVGTAIVTATAAGKTAQAQVNVTATSATPALTTLSLAITPSTVTVGATAQASATGRDQFGATIATGPLTWSATGAATISQNGLLTAVAAGTATITAIASNGISATGTLSVSATTAPALTSMSFSLASSTIPVGGTSQATVAGRDQFGAPFPTGPVTWSATGAASVNQSGLITGVSAGSASITATAANGVTSNGSITVTGNTQPATPTLSSIRVTLAPAIVISGDQSQAYAQGLDQFGNPIATGTVTWSVDQLSYATVTSTGLVTTRMMVGGPVIVTAKAGGVTGQGSLEVRYPAQVKLTLSKSRIQVGETLDATAVVLDQNGTTIDVPLSFTISCPGSCTGQASITRTSNTTATFTGVKAGPVGVLVRTPDGLAGAYQFARVVFDVVDPPELASLVVNWPASLQVGQTTTLSVSGKDQFGNPFPLNAVAYYADPTYVATITQLGELTVLRPGTVLISISATKPNRPSIIASKQYTVPGTPTARLELVAVPTGPIVNRQQIAYATPVQVQVVDIASGQPVAWQALPLAATITSGGGTLSGSTQVATNAGGGFQFTDFTVSGQTGSKTITFSAPGVLPVSWTFNLVAGAQSGIAITAGNNQTAVAGTSVAVRPSVKVTDADGNGVAGVAVVFSVTGGGGSVTGASVTTDGSGVAQVGGWTLGAAGANTLRAQAAGVGAIVNFAATATASVTAIRR